MSYRCYLFDLDGVLVDTKAWIRGAYRHTAHLFGFEASDVTLSELYGRPLSTCYEALHSTGDMDSLIQCHREFQTANAHLQRLFPHALEVLGSLQRRGASIGLISSRSGPSLRNTLDLFDLERFIDRVVWPEECQAHKPDPEPVLIALRDLNQSPSDTLVVGDTPNDIWAGRAAGTDTAGAVYGFVGEEVSLAYPTYLITQLQDLLDLPPRQV